jgi:hypothetical protein
MVQLSQLLPQMEHLRPSWRMRMRTPCAP